MKNTIIAVIILAALAGLAYGVTTIKNRDGGEVTADPCVMDFRVTLLNDVPFSMTDREAAEAILTQYLESQKKMTSCETVGIRDYMIKSLGEIKNVGNDFMIDVVFDFKPINIEKHELKTPETTVDGEWVRGKQATLGILRLQSTDENSTTTKSYRLAI